MLCTGAYLVLPFLGAGAVSGTIGLVLVFFVFELAVISALPLVSEISPQSRATLLSLGIASFGLGRAAGSFVGPAVFSNFGFPATCFVSAAGAAIALLIWLVFVREHPAAPVLAP
jgi:predicted MFS family arabinose efflux permease